MWFYNYLKNEKTMFKIATKREKEKFSNCQILSKAAIYYGKNENKSNVLKRNP